MQMLERWEMDYPVLFRKDGAVYAMVYAAYLDVYRIRRALDFFVDECLHDPSFRSEYMDENEAKFLDNPVFISGARDYMETWYRELTELVETWIKEDVLSPAALKYRMDKLTFTKTIVFLGIAGDPDTFDEEYGERLSLWKSDRKNGYWYVFQFIRDTFNVTWHNGDGSPDLERLKSRKRRKMHVLPSGRNGYETAKKDEVWGKRNCVICSKLTWKVDSRSNVPLCRVSCQKKHYERESRSRRE